MPRYFFHVRDGRSVPDDTGTELADWAEARVEAIRLCGAIIEDDAERLALSDEWYLDVEDERGLVLFRFSFISLEAPVLTSQRRTPLKPV